MSDGRGARWSWVAAVAALAFQAAGGLLTSLMGSFPASLDELQHLSFIRWTERAPRLFPRYEDMRVLDPRGERFTSAVNYLNHPSPYYLLMGLVDQAVGGSILGLRLVNLGLSLCAVALMLAAGFRLLKDWKARSIFAAVLVLFPKLGVFAGMINNDNAALLATAVTVIGLIEWQRRPSAMTALLLGLGVAFCGWTKFTVLLMMTFSVLIAEGLRLWTESKRPSLGAYAVLAGGFIVAAAPSLANIAAYGRVLHHSTAFLVPSAQRASLSFIGYAAVFAQNMAEKWSALEPSNPPQQLGLYLVLGLAAAVIVVGARRMREPDRDPDAGPAWRTASAMILAAAPVLALHLYFGWRTFIEDGFIEMAQDRYYYGLWPGVALGLALLWRNIPSRALKTPLAIVTLLLLAWSSLAVQAAAVLLAHGRIGVG